MTQCFLRTVTPNCDNDYFRRQILFSQTNCLLKRNFIKRINGHFNIVSLDTGLVRFNPYFDIRIYYSLHCNQNFHTSSLEFKPVCILPDIPYLIQEKFGAEFFVLDKNYY